MSKVKITPLDDLLAHAKITENHLVMNVVNNFIEETVLHLAHNQCWSWDDAIDGAAIKQDCIDNTDTDFPKEKGQRVGVSSQHDKTMSLVDDCDIWLRADYTVIAYWQGGFDEQDWEVNIDVLKVYWMQNEFDVSFSDAIRQQITNSILDRLW